MTTLKTLFGLFLLMAVCAPSFGQKNNLLDSLPDTKEAYMRSEKKALATIDWLMNTPLDQEESLHKTQYKLLTEWIINSPTVTITLYEDVTPFTKKNENLLLFFMAGWTKYSLENNYSNDVIKGSTAGIRSAIDIYKKGVGLKKDKAMEKLVDLEEKGKLEEWVTEQLAKK